MVGKVIKKLVKKKVFKLGLIGASLFGLMISSGFSFAKYIDTNYGNGNAGAARFGAKINNTTKFIYLPTMGSSTSPYGYYAFIAEFCVDFSECEVKAKYNLGLKLCGRYSTNYNNPEYRANNTNFTLTGTTNKVYTATGGVNEQSTIVLTDVEKLLTNGVYEKFDFSTNYYATSKDGLTYTWYNKSSTSSQEVLFSNIGAEPNDLHYYKIIYFIYLTGSNAEISIILSNLEVEQVV